MSLSCHNVFYLLEFVYSALSGFLIIFVLADSLSQCHYHVTMILLTGSCVLCLISGFLWAFLPLPSSMPANNEVSICFCVFHFTAHDINLLVNSCLMFLILLLQHSVWVVFTMLHCSSHHWYASAWDTLQCNCINPQI